MILEIYECGPAETNTVLIGCSETKKAAIIDVPFDSAALLIEALEKHSLTPEMILLTHSHWDHLGEAALLKKKLNIPIFIHREDAKNLEQPGSDGLPLFFPVEGTTPDQFLEEGQHLKIGNIDVQVIHTPGHTPGGVCFWIPKEKLLVSGDTLFRGTIGNLSFPTARPPLMWESLKKLGKLPPETRVIPGHGEATTIGAEKRLFDSL